MHQCVYILACPCFLICVYISACVNVCVCIIYVLVCVLLCSCIVQCGFVCVSQGPLLSVEETSVVRACVRASVTLMPTALNRA